MQLGIFAGNFAGSGMSSLVLVAAMVLIFYFMLIRPQNKENKRKQAMLESMEIDDTILTTSGFYGTLIDIEEDTVIVEFGSSRHCRIPMQKSAIMAVEKAEDGIDK